MHKALNKFLVRISSLYLFNQELDHFFDAVGIKKEMISDAVGLFLVILIAVGLRTRLCSFILIIWMVTLNFIVNDFWDHSNTSVMYDFKRYGNINYFFCDLNILVFLDFFQTLTVVGGLNLLLALGPGTIALDDKKDT
jgi:ER-derived vesicles protein